MSVRLKSKPAAGRGARRVAPGPATPQPDLDRALELAMALMAIPGPSGNEGKVAAYITRQLRKAGAAASAITSDDVHRRTPLGGEQGNLVFTLKGTLRAPRRLLMAHMDTVGLCVGSKPLLKNDRVASADKTTGLGADDRAGCAVVLTAALEILRRRLPHPPLAFFWPVQEEVGLFGAHFGRMALLKKPRLAFNWDGGAAAKVTLGATGAYRLAIEIRGKASHAGGAPEHGVSAIAIAGLAIAQLQRDGWLGDVRRGDQRGTSNIGVIHGGSATNVVTDRVVLKAEARSHDPAFRLQIVGAFQQAFEQAAGQVKSATGESGTARMVSRLDYEAFRLDPQEPCVLAAGAALRAAGAEPQLAISNGGLDANWLTARGIPTVTLGCGQHKVHTIGEQLDVPAFKLACRVGLTLATATEQTARLAADRP